MTVPISLVYRKDQLRVGGQGMPALLEAYGAYGSPFPPYFNAGRISILERHVHTIAHRASQHSAGRL